MNNENPKDLTNLNVTYNKFIKPGLISREQPKNIQSPAQQQQSQQQNQQQPQQQQADKYLEKAIMTASAQDLVLMLYDGAIRFMTQAITMINEKKIQDTNTLLIKAENIFSELMSNLDYNYEISNNLLSLYAFIYDTLFQANMKKDPVLVQEAIDLTKELRITWNEAMKLSKGVPSKSIVPDEKTVNQ